LRLDSAGSSRSTLRSSVAAKLVEVWLEDVELASSTRLHERNMKQLVMPTFEHYILREITAERCYQRNRNTGTRMTMGQTRRSLP
jgi:hypothetical protein